MHNLTSIARRDKVLGHILSLYASILVIANQIIDTLLEGDSHPLRRSRHTQQMLVGCASLAKAKEKRANTLSPWEEKIAA